jgi:hypothetical protein
MTRNGNDLLYLFAILWEALSLARYVLITYAFGTLWVRAGGINDISKSLY